MHRYRANLCRVFCLDENAIILITDLPVMYLMDNLNHLQQITLIVHRVMHIALSWKAYQ